MKNFKRFLGKGAMLLLSLMLAVGAVPEIVPFEGNIMQVEAANTGTTANPETGSMKEVHISGESPYGRSVDFQRAMALSEATKVVLDDSVYYFSHGLHDDNTYTGTSARVNGKKILDLNGHTISLKLTSQWGMFCAFLLNKDCDLTIIDSKGGGSIEFLEEGTCNNRSLVRGYQLEMFRAMGDNVKLTINGGTFKCDYSFNRYVDAAYDYKDPDVDDDANLLARMAHWNLWSGCLIYNLDYNNINVCINGGTFETASQSSTLQDNLFLAYDEENCPREMTIRPTSFFMNDNSAGTMSVTVNDGSFLSKNGASMADGNVSLQLKGGKYKFERYNKLLSGITAVEKEKTHKNSSSQEGTYPPVHSGHIGKLPSVDQIAFADDAVLDVSFSGVNYNILGSEMDYYTWYEKMSDYVNNNHNDTVSLRLTPKEKTDATPMLSIEGQKMDISGNSIRNSLIYLPGKQMKLHWQLTDYFNPGTTLLDTTGIEHTENPVIWLTELNPEGLPVNTARCFLTDGCIDLDALTNSKWADGENNISFLPGYTYFFTFSGTELYEAENEYVIQHKPVVDRVYFRVPTEEKSIDSVKVYMENADYAGTNTILPHADRTAGTVEFESQSEEAEVIRTDYDQDFDETNLYPGLKFRYTVVLQAKEGKRFTNDTEYKIPGIEDITAVINPFGDQVSLFFDIRTACDHTRETEYAEYTEVDSLYHICETCGKKLVHTYTDWTQNGTKFTRTCTLCGQRDTSPLGGTITKLIVSPSDYLSGVAVGQPISIPRDIQVMYGAKEYAPSFQATELKWYRYEDEEYPTYVDPAKLIEVKDGETFLHERYLLKYKFTLPNVSDSGFTSATLVGFGERNNAITETAGRRIQLENIFTFGDDKVTGYRTISGYLIVEPIEYLTGSFTIPKISAGDTLSTLMNETWKNDGKLILQDWNVTDLQTAVSVTVTEQDGTQYGKVVGLAGYDPAGDPVVNVIYDCTFETDKVYKVVYGINAPNINTYGATKIYDYTVVPNANANYSDCEVKRTNSDVTVTATYEPLGVNALKVVAFTVDEPAYGKTVNPTVQGIEGLPSYTVEIEKINPKTGEVLVSSAELQGQKYEHGTYRYRVKMNTTGGQWQLPALDPANASFNGEEADLFERQWLAPTSGGAKGKYYFVFEKAYTIDHSWVIDSQTFPACEMDAVAVYHCEYCGETGESIVVKRLGHTDLRFVQKCAAYCSRIGYKVDCYLCPHCGKAFSDKDGKISAGDVWIAMNPNSHNPDHVTYESDKDSHWEVCGDCGEVLSEAAAHGWDDDYYYDEEEEEEVYLGVCCSECGLYADKEFSVEMIGGKVLDRYGNYVSQTNYPKYGGCPLTLIPDVAEDEIFLGWESTIEIEDFYPDSCDIYLVSRDCPVTITAKTKKSPCGSEHFYRVEADSANRFYHYFCRNCEKEVIKPFPIYRFDGTDDITVVSVKQFVNGAIFTEIYLDIPQIYLTEDVNMVVYRGSGNLTIPLNSLTKETISGTEYYKAVIESPFKDSNSQADIMIYDAEKIPLPINQSGEYDTRLAITLADAGSDIVVISQPNDVTATAGETAVFKITAAGEELKYRWKKSTDGGRTWANSASSGAASNTLTMTTKASFNGYKFKCVITDKYGKTLESNMVRLTVKAALAVTAQPSNVTAAAGENVTFKIAATGENLKYQWKKSTDGGKTWVNSASTGATTNTLTMVTKATYNGYKFKCEVTDKNGKIVESNAATLTVTAAVALTITTQPANATVAAGDNVTFQIVATGEGLKYQWKKSTDGGKTWVNSASAGAATNTLTMTTKATYNGYKFKCVVTDKNGKTAESNAATLTVAAAGTLAITSQPANAVAAAGDDVTFRITATGDTLKYQWKKSTDGGKTWVNSSSTGCTTNTLTMTTKASFDGIQFKCVVTDKNGKTVTSNTATLTVVAAGALAITTQPSNVTVTAGAAATFQIAAIGTGLKYQWRKSTDGGKTWVNSSSTGCTTNTLTMTAKASFNGIQFKCVVTDGNGKTVTSNIATLTVK